MLLLPPFDWVIILYLVFVHTPRKRRSSLRPHVLGSSANFTLHQSGIVVHKVERCRRRHTMDIQNVVQGLKRGAGSDARGEPHGDLLAVVRSLQDSRNLTRRREAIL